MRFSSMIFVGTAAFAGLAFMPGPVSQEVPPVESTTGMVVSVNGYASDIGAAILARGGNAVDAAVATAMETETDLRLVQLS